MVSLLCSTNLCFLLRRAIQSPQALLLFDADVEFRFADAPAFSITRDPVWQLSNSGLGAHAETDQKEKKNRY